MGLHNLKLSALFIGVVLALIIYLRIGKTKDSPSVGVMNSKSVDKASRPIFVKPTQTSAATANVGPPTTSSPAVQFNLEEAVSLLLRPYIIHVKSVEHKSSVVLEDSTLNGVQKVVIRFTGVDESWFAQAASELLAETSKLPTPQRNEVLSEALKALKRRAEPEYQKKSLFISNPENGSGKFETMLVLNNDADPITNINGKLRPSVSNGKLLYLNESTVSTEYSHLFKIAK
jgi:hypothetical protein